MPYRQYAAGNGGNMDHQKDTSLNDKTFSDHAQGGSPEGFSQPARQGSLSEDSPYRSSQGSLSGDSRYRSGQGSLSGDGSNRSGRGPISDGSSCQPGRALLSDDLSQRDDGKKQSGGRTLAVAVLVALVIIALFLVITIIRRPSIKHYDQIAPSLSARKDTASDDMNDNETVEAEKTEQETEEEAIAEEEASAEEIALEEAAPAEEEEDAAEENEEQKEYKERYERASRLGSADALTADDFVFYEGADNRYHDFSGGLAISYEKPEENDPDDDEDYTVSARGISLLSTKDDVEEAYGPPAASGQVSDQCKFYYILHDFEGEYDESLKKTADWHLGFDYYEYYYESGCIAFDFDENGSVAAIAVDNNSRMFW